MGRRRKTPCSRPEPLATVTYISSEEIRVQVAWPRRKKGDARHLRDRAASLEGVGPAVLSALTAHSVSIPWDDGTDIFVALGRRDGTSAPYRLMYLLTAQGGFLPVRPSCPGGVAVLSATPREVYVRVPWPLSEDLAAQPGSAANLVIAAARRHMRGRLIKVCRARGAQVYVALDRRDGPGPFRRKYHMQHIDGF